jgi:hypothetical protein
VWTDPVHMLKFGHRRRPNALDRSEVGDELAGPDGPYVRHAPKAKIGSPNLGNHGTHRSNRHGDYGLR